MFPSPHTQPNAQVLLFLPRSCFPDGIAFLLDWQGISVERARGRLDLVQKAVSGNHELIVTDSKTAKELATETDTPVIDVETFLFAPHSATHPSIRFNGKAFLNQVRASINASGKERRRCAEGVSRKSRLLGRNAHWPSAPQTARLLSQTPSCSTIVVLDGLRRAQARPL